MGMWKVWIVIPFLTAPQPQSPARRVRTHQESLRPDPALKISYGFGLKETCRENLFPLSSLSLGLAISGRQYTGVGSDLYYLSVELQLNLEDKVKEIVPRRIFQTGLQFRVWGPRKVQIPWEAYEPCIACGAGAPHRMFLPQIRSWVTEGRQEDTQHPRVEGRKSHLERKEGRGGRKGGSNWDLWEWPLSQASDTELWQSGKWLRQSLILAAHWD